MTFYGSIRTFQWWKFGGTAVFCRGPFCKITNKDSNKLTVSNICVKWVKVKGHVAQGQKSGSHGSGSNVRGHVGQGQRSV